MTKTIVSNKRIQWVDCAKGIAILLVIIGHTINNPVIRGPIFSFHMPLFFILSGYTSKCSNSKKDFLKKSKKSAVHILVPAYLIYFIRLPLIMLRDHLNYSLFQISLSVLYSSGMKNESFDVQIPAFGMMWFLIVLFSIRTLYDAIQLVTKGKYMLIISSAFCVAGVIIGKIVFLPFSFDLTLSAIFFFGLGQKLKEIDTSKFSVAMFVIMLLTWTSTFVGNYFITHTYLELAARRYPMFPICFITATAGSFVLCYISIEIERYMPMLNKMFCYIGKNSIYLFVIHALDTIWQPYYSELIGNNTILITFTRLFVDLLLLTGYLKWRSLKMESPY